MRKEFKMSIKRNVKAAHGLLFVAQPTPGVRQDPPFPARPPPLASTSHVTGRSYSTHPEMPTVIPGVAALPLHPDSNANMVLHKRLASPASSPGEVPPCTCGTKPAQYSARKRWCSHALGLICSLQKLRAGSKFYK